MGFYHFPVLCSGSWTAVILKDFPATQFQARTLAGPQSSPNSNPTTLSHNTTQVSSSLLARTQDQGAYPSILEDSSENISHLLVQDKRSSPGEETATWFSAYKVDAHNITRQLPESAIRLWQSLESPFFLLMCLRAMESGLLGSKVAWKAGPSWAGGLPDKHFQSSAKTGGPLSSMKSRATGHQPPASDSPHLENKGCMINICRTEQKSSAGIPSTE